MTPRIGRGLLLLILALAFVLTALANVEAGRGWRREAVVEASVVVAAGCRGGGGGSGGGVPRRSRRRRVLS